LVELPVAVRTRWWRSSLAEAGATVADLSSTHVRWLEGLIVGWTGQGPVDIPGGLQVSRADGHVHVRRSGRVE
jgi:tRNA(Ile)-lysidine synthase